MNTQIRYGKWIKTNERNHVYKCSRCGCLMATFEEAIEPSKAYNECPVCEAKMDGGNENEHAKNRWSLRLPFNLRNLGRRNVGGCLEG